MRIKILAFLSMFPLVGCDWAPEKIIGTLVASRCEQECRVVIEYDGIDKIIKEYKSCASDNKVPIGHKVIAFKQELDYGNNCMNVYEYLQR